MNVTFLRKGLLVALGVGIVINVLTFTVIVLSPRPGGPHVFQERKTEVEDLKQSEAYLGIGEIIEIINHRATIRISEVAGGSSTITFYLGGTSADYKVHSKVEVYEVSNRSGTGIALKPLL
jgi:hypothetical protein